MKIYELLSDESRWTKGVFARDEKGNSVETNSPKACRWCLLGALYKCYSYEQNF